MMESEKVMEKNQKEMGKEATIWSQNFILIDWFCFLGGGNIFTK